MKLLGVLLRNFCFTKSLLIFGFAKNSPLLFHCQCAEQTTLFALQKACFYLVRAKLKICHLILYYSEVFDQSSVAEKIHYTVVSLSTLIHRLKYNKIVAQ